MADEGKIVVWRMGNIGDTVVALPAFNALRRHFGSERLVLLTSPGLRGHNDPSEIVAPSGIFSRIIRYRSTGPGKLAELPGLLSKVRSLRPGLAVCMDYLFANSRRAKRNRLFFELAGCRRIVGTKPSQDDVSPGHSMSEIDRLLEIAAMAGVEDLSVDFEIDLTPGEVASAAEMMSRWGGDTGPSGRTVLLCPGAGVPVNRWPLERYRGVVESLIARGIRVAVVGGLEDQDAGVYLASVGGPVLDLTGRTTLRETFALMSHADLYVGNNTGAMHMAAASGVPCVAVMSARDPDGSWGPYGKGHVILGTRPDCQACMKDTCDDARCILSVTPDAVVDACMRKLEAARS